MFLEIYLDMTKKIVTDFFATFQRLLISANTQSSKIPKLKYQKHNIILNANIQFLNTNLSR